MRVPAALLSPFSECDILYCMPINRFVVIVLDSLGVGELPDAAAYGDVGSHTLGNMARAVGGLKVPHLEAMGLGNITIAGRKSRITLRRVRRCWRCVYCSVRMTHKGGTSSTPAYLRRLKK